MILIWRDELKHENINATRNEHRSKDENIRMYKRAHQTS